jgi:hypothetical protein
VCVSVSVSASASVQLCTVISWWDARGDEVGGWIGQNFFHLIIDEASFSVVLFPKTPVLNALNLDNGHAEPTTAHQRSQSNSRHTGTQAHRHTGTQTGKKAIHMYVWKRLYVWGVMGMNGCGENLKVRECSLTPEAIVVKPFQNERELVAAPIHDVEIPSCFLPIIGILNAQAVVDDSVQLLRQRILRLCQSLVPYKANQHALTHMEVSMASRGI